jgi:uncharacterized protein YbjQ (UPF0145 family)/predicted RNA-binding Zn-ribbon protein involved in translation (DUF1610 family)
MGKVRRLGPADALASRDFLTPEPAIQSERHYAWMMRIQCLNCRQVVNADEYSTSLGCANCGVSYLRRCHGCGLISQVPPGQEDGDPWDCAWCAVPNHGFSRRKDKDIATVADLAWSFEQRGIQPAEPLPEPAPMLIVTMNEIPGYRIIQVHGDVFGLVVRARNVFSNLGASLRTVAGGEVVGYTKLLTDSRHQARARMWREALALGGNAVVAMRFDCNEIGDIMSEVAAYGTAVTVQPIEAPDHAPQL